MALSAQQLTDFRADIADENQAFSDPELQRLHDRAGSYEGAVLLAIDQLIANAAKLTEYRMNMTMERRQQVIGHLAAHVRPIWEARLARLNKKQQTRVVRLTGIGNSKRVFPGEES